MMSDPIKLFMFKPFSVFILIIKFNDFLAYVYHYGVLTDRAT